MRSRIAMGIASYMAALLVGGAPAMAQEAASKQGSVNAHGSPSIPASISLPAGELTAALDMLSQQTGTNIIYRPEHVQGVRVQQLSGNLSAIEAVNRLLAWGGLKASTDPRTGSILISQTSEAEPIAPPPAARREPGVTDVETMVVTGTRIRGGATPSPVITIGSEKIKEEGFTDLGQVIRSIPQNFGGGQNPEVGSGGLSGAGAVHRNVTGGSSLNLRGLGPDATLTLLNGRRLSYSGTVQSVDISAIPVEAVDRIEVVADGASAIYGSDAVGGVGNVILRRDFDGLVVGARRGAAADGGLSTSEYTVTTGTTWESGGWIGTWKQSSIDPIYASQRSYTNHLVPPTTIYPGSDLRSVLVGGHQRLGERVRLQLDALRTKRDQNFYFEYFGTNWLQSGTITEMVSPGMEIALGSDWTLTLGGAWSRDEFDGYQTIADEATGISTVINNKSRSFDVGAEGSWFSVGGGEVRVAIGVGHRWNDFMLANRSTVTNIVEGEESSRFAYAEMAVPLIGPGQQLDNVRRLELTAAVRGEDYKTVGGVVTPKLGMVYGPSRDVTFKASWGKAFKAPTLNERYRDSVAYVHVPEFFGGSGYGDDATVLYVGGGNPNLAPERARTWVGTIAFHPEAIPGLEAEIGYFDIDYQDRVVEPIPDITQAMSNPNYALLIQHSPGAGEQARVLAGIDQFFNFTGNPYDADSVVALIFGQRSNVARQRIKGIDVSGSYRFDVARGSLTLRGSGSWLDSSQQNIEGQSAYALSGTLFNPARRRARIGAVWNQGGFNASAFANYTAGVEDVANVEKTASFTTFDAAGRYEFGGRGGVWSGVGIALSVHNLLDRAPPLHTPALVGYAAPYDGTNYSAVGRFFALSISKSF